MGIKFDKDPLVVEQNNYATKIENAYLVYDLDDWSKNPLDNFKLRSCLFGATNVVRNSDKEKWVYSGYGIAFDGSRSWNFDISYTRNVLIFGIDNSSSSPTDNRKNNILVLGEAPTYGISGNFGSPENNFSINFNKAKTNFCLSLHYNYDNSYLSVNRKEIFKFKADNKNVYFLTQFHLGSISNGFSTTESTEIFLKGNVYDFSIDYRDIDRTDILNIHYYSMVKNNIK